MTKKKAKKKVAKKKTKKKAAKKKKKFKVVTVGLVPFSKENLKHISTNMGKSQKKIIEWDSKMKLRIRGSEDEEKILVRAKRAYKEFKGALDSQYVLVNPYGEDNIAAWENRIWGVELVVSQLKSILDKYEGEKILLVLCGPSCAGKGPLANALISDFDKRGKINIGKAIITVDEKKRPPRENESEGKPYHFRSLEHINEMIKENPDQYIVLNVRGVKQALDLNEVDELLRTKDIAFVEIFHTAIADLRKWANN